MIEKPHLNMCAPDDHSLLENVYVVVYFPQQILKISGLVLFPRKVSKAPLPKGVQQRFPNFWGQPTLSRYHKGF